MNETHWPSDCAGCVVRRVNANIPWCGHDGLATVSVRDKRIETYVIKGRLTRPQWCLGPVTPPARIQRSRGARLPPNTICVTRPGPLGNPFPVSVFGLEQSLAFHAAWIETETAEELGYTGDDAERLNAQRAEVKRLLPTMRGMNIACWCRVPTEPYQRDKCHGALLLRLANS